MADYINVLQVCPRHSSYGNIPVIYLYIICHMVTAAYNFCVKLKQKMLTG